VSTNDGAPARVRARSRAATALLPRFLEHRRRDVATIQEALERGDFEAIRTIGHNLSGNGLSYGFPEMSAIGKRLQAGADAESAGAVREQLASLEASLARVGEELAGDAEKRTESGTRARVVTGDSESTGQKTRER